MPSLSVPCNCFSSHMELNVGRQLGHKDIEFLKGNGNVVPVEMIWYTQQEVVKWLVG